MHHDRIFEPASSASDLGRACTRGADDEFVDIAVLAELREVLSTELFAMRLAIFVEEANGMGVLLHALSRDHKTARLGALAHKFSGAAALFGAGALRDALARIEVSVRTHQTDRLDGLVRGIAPIASRTIESLARIRFS